MILSCERCCGGRKCHSFECKPSAVNRMTQVKLGGGSRQVLTRKMQRYSLMKAGGALIFICGFVALLFRSDPLPSVRKAAMRHRLKGDDVQKDVVGRDFRDPAETNVVEGKVQQEDKDEDGGQLFTFELASLKGGTTGKVVIKTKPSWAPIGVERFHELMEEQFYDQGKFFRVVDDFIVQFGISADPSKPKPSKIPDDPSVQTNSRGTVTFAMSGKNSRTCQLFINTRPDGNKFLDNQGFAPFAEIVR
jgi:cyclophilin family peptidyl-prolyl cis-trans isomerase